MTLKPPVSVCSVTVSTGLALPVVSVWTPVPYGPYVSSCASLSLPLTVGPHIVITVGRLTLPASEYQYGTSPACYSASRIPFSASASDASSFDSPDILIYKSMGAELY